MTPTRKDISRRLREILSGAREQRRELTLAAQRQGDFGCLDASGAINLTIRDILPTIDNSLQLPPGLELETGVTGNEVWPISIDDVEMEEEGEVETLTDQGLGFAHQMSSTPVRTGITVEVSNRAIDNSSFDLLAYVQAKFALAQRRYIASRLYTTADIDGNAGPFSFGHVQEWSVPANGLYDSIMAQMTALEEAGFDTKDACIVVDFDMELRLKCTPVRVGEGHMIIENGLCAGYPYVANKYFNTELDATTGKLVKKDSDAIGIAVFKWFKISQHDKARLIVDGKSDDLAQRNVTAITLNTAWAFTDLSKHINGGDHMQAFHTLVMDRGYLADNGDHIFETSDGFLLQVGLSRYEMALADTNSTPLLAADDQPIMVNL